MLQNQALPQRQPPEMRPRHVIEKQYNGIPKRKRLVTRRAVRERLRQAALAAPGLESDPDQVLKRPHLPTEIWIVIIGHVLAIEIPRRGYYYCSFAWLDFRRVSKMFRWATEKAFAESAILRGIRVYGWHYVDESPGLCFKFDGFSHDAEHMYLAADCENLEEDPATIREKFLNLGSYHIASGNDMGRLPDCLKPLVSHLPPGAVKSLGNLLHTDRVVVLGASARDAELPGLQSNAKRQEMRFEWRLMLDRFFGEEQFRRRLLAKVPASIYRNTWPTDRNGSSHREIGSPLLTMWHLYTLDQARIAVERRVRYGRLTHWLQRHGISVPSGLADDKELAYKIEEGFDDHKDFRVRLEREDCYETVNWESFEDGFDDGDSEHDGDWEDDDDSLYGFDSSSDDYDYDHPELRSRKERDHFRDHFGHLGDYVWEVYHIEDVDFMDYEEDLTGRGIKFLGWSGLDRKLEDHTDDYVLTMANGSMVLVSPALARRYPGKVKKVKLYYHSTYPCVRELDG